MSRYSQNQLFVGRLPRSCRERDLEDIFYRYGKLLRCDVKTGLKMSYGFIEYEDRRDAEDAIEGEHGRDMHGSRIVVEWARGPRYDYRRDEYRHDNDRRRSPRRDRYRRSRSRSYDRERRRSRSRSNERRRSRSKEREPRRSVSPEHSRRSHSRSVDRSPVDRRSPSD